MNDAGDVAQMQWVWAHKRQRHGFEPSPLCYPSSSQLAFGAFAKVGGGGDLGQLLLRRLGIGVFAQPARLTHLLLVELSNPSRLPVNHWKASADG